MRALVLAAYDPDLETALGNLRVGLRPVPSLKPSQVLVKMEAAPCNPSDLLFLHGPPPTVTVKGKVQAKGVTFKEIQGMIIDNLRKKLFGNERIR